MPNEMEQMLRGVARIIEGHIPLESDTGEPGDAGCSCDAKLGEYTWPGYCKHLAGVLRESGLLRLLEAGQKLRDWAEDSGDADQWEVLQAEWDAAKAAMKEQVHEG